MMSDTILPSVTFLELELTGRCQLACVHCYAESGPTGTHGTMTEADWRNVMDAGRECGVTTVQFIGGEATLHPDFADLAAYALNSGLAIEVFTNLLRVRQAWWKLYEHPKASLATSYYSDRADEHDAITGQVGSFAKTRGNIIEVVKRQIPLRVSVVDLGGGQRVVEAKADLESLGVTRVRVDRMRAVGRGRREIVSSAAELCGRCGHGNAAISATGEVTACVMSRFLPPAGNVKTAPLADIFEGPGWSALVQTIPTRAADRCDPDSDSAPMLCGPDLQTPPQSIGRSIGARR